MANSASVRRIAAVGVLIASIVSSVGAADDAPPRPDVIRPAAAILRDYDTVTAPSMIESSDPVELARFDRAQLEAAEKRQALALELAASHPIHARVPELLRMRWTLFSTVQEDGERALRETERWLAARPAPAIVAAAAATRALAAITLESADFEQRRQLIAASEALAPKEVLVHDAWLELAWKHTADPAVQRERVERVRANFAADADDDDDVTWNLRLVERLLARIGQPLDLRFDGVDRDRSVDAPRSLAEWRGRPCLVHLQIWTPTWTEGVQQPRYAALAALRERRPASELPLLSVLQTFDESDPAPWFRAARANGLHTLWIDRADWQRSIARDQVGTSRGGSWLLVDADGVLRAWSWNLAELARQVDLLLAPKRRAS